MNENDSTPPTDDEPATDQSEQPRAAASGIGKARWILRGLLLGVCVASIVLIATGDGEPPAAKDPVKITIGRGAKDYGSAWFLVNGKAGTSDVEIRTMLKSPPDAVLLRVEGGVYQHEVDRVRSMITNAAPDTQIQLKLITDLESD